MLPVTPSRWSNQTPSWIAGSSLSLRSSIEGDVSASSSAGLSRFSFSYIDICSAALAAFPCRDAHEGVVHGHTMSRASQQRCTELGRGAYRATSHAKLLPRLLFTCSPSDGDHQRLAKASALSTRSTISGTAPEAHNRAHCPHLVE